MSSDSEPQDIFPVMPEGLLVDPDFAEFLTRVSAAQNEIDELDEPDTDEITIILRKLNDEWETLNWYRSPMNVTGKVRVAPYHDEGSCISDMTKSYHPGADDRGQYYVVSEHEMICGEFGIDAELDGDEIDPFSPKIGLYLMTQHGYDEFRVDFNGDEPDPDCLIAYPSELGQVQFAEPSERALRDYLECYHAEILSEIDGQIPLGPLGNSRMRTVLQDFFIDLTEAQRDDPDIMSKIEAYVEARIGYGQDMYKVQVTGEVATIDDEGDEVLVDVSDKSPLTIYGYIAKIGLSELSGEDSAGYGIEVTLAVPSRSNNGTMQVVKVNGMDLTAIRNLQHTATILAKTASMQFYDIASIREFSARLIDAGNDTGVQPEEFYEIIQPTSELEELFGVSPESYDETADVYHFDVNKHIADMAQAIGELLESLGYDIGDLPQDSSELAEIHKTLVANSDTFTAFVPRGTITVGGPCVVTAIANGETYHGGFMKLSKDRMIAGQLCYPTVGLFPDLASRITDGVVGGVHPELAIAVSAPLISSGEGLKITSGEQLFLIPITGDESPVFGANMAAPEH